MTDTVAGPASPGEQDSGSGPRPQPSDTTASGDPTVPGTPDGAARTDAVQRHFGGQDIGLAHLGPGVGLEWSSPDHVSEAPAGSGPKPVDFSSHSSTGPGLTYDPGYRAGSQDAPSSFEPAADTGRPADSGPTGRHPFDPDQVRSTKAAAVLALGVAAVITGPLIGGLVPAGIALLLAREARDDVIAGQGYLTGGRQIRLGLTLAWVGIALAVAALVAASVLGILSLAEASSQDFPNTSD